jgi:hypothetical protein
MHNVALGAPRDIRPGPRPVLLQRNDEDFIESTLDELRTPQGRATLAGRRARSANAQGTLKLFQPIQRQFHVALVQAWCDTPGSPRVDPSRVDASGMVVRRLGAGGQLEGWMRSNGRVRGWVPLSRTGGPDADPVAAHRLQRQLTGVADLDRQLSGFALALADNRLDEDVVPTFMAPPDVCAAAAQTLFYGVVPTVSSELSEAPPARTGPQAVDFGPESGAFKEHLVAPLQGFASSFPYAGQDVVAGWFDASESSPARPPEGVTAAQLAELSNPDAGTGKLMRDFLLLLRQLGSEFNAFDGGEDSATLRAELAKVTLSLVLREGETVARTTTADVFLSKACQRLLKKERVDGLLEMPTGWPELGSTATRALQAALHGALQARSAALVSQSSRYDEPGAQYVLRAFVRLKPEGPCPARVVWSANSEPYVIAPWFETADARPPLQIPLPDASDRNMLKALKPNVAFVVPPSMQNLLSGKAKDLMEGKGSMGQLGLTWICGFNIPIITICAFIVLNIFLTLFNLVFGWLFFIKICIPFPKFGSKAPPPPPFT